MTMIWLPMIILIIIVVVDDDNDWLVHEYDWWLFWVIIDWFMIK